MKILVPAIFLTMLSLASSAAMADDDYVLFAKQLEAKRYDNELPSLSVEEWLISALPSGIEAVWGITVTDCGEQTGNPEIDRARDMPLCAEIELREKGGPAGYLLLFIGTEKKGKLKDNASLYYGYIKKDDKIVQIKKLREIDRLKR